MTNIIKKILIFDSEFSYYDYYDYFNEFSENYKFFSDN